MDQAPACSRCGHIVLNDGRCLSCGHREHRDDTPTSPQTRDQLEAIAREMRHRSTQITKIIDIRAHEIVTSVFGYPLGDPRVGPVREHLRVACQLAIDAAHQRLSGELAAMKVERDGLIGDLAAARAEVERLQKRIEAMRRSRDR